MSRLDLLTANDRIGHYPASYYAARGEDAMRAKLSGNHKADICIIGGGLTGVSAALNAAKMGAKVILLEASRICFGASGRNGGQIGTGQRADQGTLERQYGFERAKRLFDIGLSAHDYVVELCNEHNIDIDYRPGIAHTVFSRREFNEEAAYAEKLAHEYGYSKMEVLDADQMRAQVNSPAYHGGVIDWGGGHGDPLRLAIGIAKAAEAAGAVIFEDSRVLSLDPAQTEEGAVEADHYILACNGYLGELDGETARYVMPINNFVVATEVLGEARMQEMIPQNIAIADSKFVVNYFRPSPDHRLLFGGGESYGYRFPRDLAGKAGRPMRQIFPQLEEVAIDYAWGGTLAITMNRMPYVRRRGNLWVSAGYSGHGVALATYMGRLMAEAIDSRSDEFDLMTSLRHHPFPGGNALRQPLLVAAMLWYQMRDAFGL